MPNPCATMARSDITAIVSIITLLGLVVGAFFLFRRRYNPDWLATVVSRLDQTSLTIFSTWLFGVITVSSCGSQGERRMGSLRRAFLFPVFRAGKQKAARGRLESGRKRQW